MKSPESSIPEKCLNCPSILMRNKHIDAHEHKVDDLINSAMSDSPDHAAEAISEFFSEMPDLKLGIDTSPEELARFFRAHDGMSAQGHNHLIKEHQAEMVDFAKGCLGSLKLRGSRDGRRVVTAEVCMSPRLDDSDSTESVNVNRTII